MSMFEIDDGTPEILAKHKPLVHPVHKAAILDSEGTQLCSNDVVKHVTTGDKFKLTGEVFPDWAVVGKSLDGSTTGHLWPSKLIKVIAAQEERRDEAAATSPTTTPVVSPVSSPLPSTLPTASATTDPTTAPAIRHPVYPAGVLPTLIVGSDGKTITDSNGVALYAGAKVFHTILERSFILTGEVSQYNKYSMAHVEREKLADVYRVYPAHVVLESLAVEDIQGSLASETSSPTPKTDPVNHPTHYTSHPSGVECIQVTEHMGFNLGNAMKYIWRADLKSNATEDLRKAIWYLERELTRRAAQQPKPQTSEGETK